MNENKGGLLCSGFALVYIERKGNRIFIITESQLDETIEEMSQEFDITIADKEDFEKLHMTLFEENVWMYISQYQKLTKKGSKKFISYVNLYFYFIKLKKHMAEYILYD